MAGDGATFYYDTNSPYAYLAAQRIQDVLPDATWRPVALPLLFRAIGKTPWSLGPDREAGQAEIARRAEERGLPPVQYADGWPAETWSFTPLRAAVFAEERGAQVPFALEAYRLMFAEGRSLGELDTVLDAARGAVLDPDEIREAVDGEPVKDRLKEYTDEAIGLGAVGVPTVAVGGELYWGDDRLEEAAAAADS